MQKEELDNSSPYREEKPIWLTVGKKKMAQFPTSSRDRIADYEPLSQMMLCCGILSIIWPIQIKARSYTLERQHGSGWIFFFQWKLKVQQHKNVFGFIPASSDWLHLDTSLSHNL